MEWIIANPELSIAIGGLVLGTADVIVGKYVPVAYKGVVNTFLGAVKGIFIKKPPLSK